ncbi:MAG: DUF5615 family PIN-like protein [Gemmatimonadota bacterium]
MRFLADESCDFAVVRALRAVDHDVVAIAEISPRATDEVVMEPAIREGRILLTEDKDFGQLVQANQAAAGGVFLLRFPARVRADLPGAVVKLVERRGEGLLGRFVVLQPGRVRISRPPAGQVGREETVDPTSARSAPGPLPILEHAAHGSYLGC